MKQYVVTKLVRHEERFFATDMADAIRIAQRTLGPDWRASDRVRLHSIVEVRETEKEVA